MCCTELNTVNHKTHFLKLTSISALIISIYLEKCFSDIVRPSITSEVVE